MRYKQVHQLTTILSIVFLAGMGVQAIAQNATGAINGIVSDPNNEMISNAVVTVTNKATGVTRKITTKSEGTFRFENMVPA